jgi:hypothetical protein
MFVVGIVLDGALGLALLIAPAKMFSLLGFPSEELIWAGAGSSISAAGGILCAVGLRSPLKYSPFLLLQLLAWVLYYPAVIIPKIMTGTLPSYADFFSVIGVLVLIGDAIVIPWRYLFAK